MRTLPHLVGLACLIASSGASIASAAEAPVTPIPSEIAPYVPLDMRGYFVGFLIRPSQPKEMPFDLFVRHQEYLRQQVASGVYVLAGPFTGDSGMRGMIILSAKSADEARAVLRGDPAVQRGVFDVEVQPAMFPNLAGISVRYPAPQAIAN